MGSSSTNTVQGDIHMEIGADRTGLKAGRLGSIDGEARCLMARKVAGDGVVCSMNVDVQAVLDVDMGIKAMLHVEAQDQMRQD